MERDRKTIKAGAGENHIATERIESINRVRARSSADSPALGLTVCLYFNHTSSASTIPDSRES